MLRIIYICIVTLFSTTLSWAQNLEDELNSTELKTIKSGEFIQKSKDVKGSPWPELTFYAVVNALPLEAVGIFAAYDTQKDYVPNVIISKPIKHVSATDVHTQYELRMPFPLPNTRSIHGAKIFKHQNDYEVQWYMVESSSALDVKGSAYFQSYEGKTLLRYRSSIKPKSIFGGAVKSLMARDVLASITAIRLFIEKNKRENPAYVSKHSEFITRALNGEFVYQTIINQK